MNLAEKKAEIDELQTKFAKYGNVYITDASSLTVAEINALRRSCFKNGIEMRVAKNTLIKKAMEAHNPEAYKEIYDALHGPTYLLFSDVSNAPAKVIKDFRKDKERPILKGAWIESSVFMGDKTLKELVALKSKNELLGEIIGLLQSPAKNVVSALQSGGNKLSGLLKALENRAN